MLLLASVGCGEETPAGARDVELSGYVREDETHRAISGAAVEFTSDVLDVSRTSTDDEGYYEMAVTTGVATGRVRASKAGYLPSEASVYFDTSSRRVDLELRRESAPPPMD